MLRNTLNLLPQKIAFNSAELVCFHEAGHAVSAYDCGATVIGMELFRAETRPKGLTRVSRNHQQKPLIAVGGFAAEYVLFKAGRLEKEDNTAPTEKEFINHAADNAHDDRISYFGRDCREGGYWPEEMDRYFMKHAVQYAEHEMDFKKVEAVAGALFQANKLTQAQIDQLLV